jgi:predicted neuraminidase
MFNRPPLSSLSTALGLLVAALLGLESRAFAQPGGAVQKSGFISDPLPTPSCHASTIAETDHGLIAAWFGGTDEGESDVGIWMSRYENGGWGPATRVVAGDEDGPDRKPCWNPVLFHSPNGRHYLFYKVGAKPSSWWGRYLSSTDEGRTWFPSARLPDGMLGPVRNKPVLMPDGLILCGSSTEDAGWRVHMEIFNDHSRRWTRGPNLNEAMEFAAIQPTILQWPDGRIQILCRTKQEVITECWSTNKGRTWTRMRKTALLNPNSGIDAVMLKGGTALLVHNNSPKDRSPLNVSISTDGMTWQPVLVLEDTPGEFSYPAVIQTSDGLVHVTYTWKRQKIKHVVLDPAKLRAGN